VANANITLPDLDIEVTGVWRYFPENALAHSLAAGIGSEPHSLGRGFATLIGMA
jgi:hypothetical protein